MHNSKLNEILAYRHNLKTWHFLALCVLFSVICVLALRDNYQTMTELRDQVYVADKNDGNVEGALQDLRSHVTSHMNTNLSSGHNSVYPPIQLKYTYQRLVVNF